jgi:hypothetical protein
MSLRVPALIKRSSPSVLLLRLVVLAVVGYCIGVSDSSAVTLGSVEIDADDAAVQDALYSQSAYDWAESASSGSEGVFLLGTGGNPDFLNCYASNVSVNPAVDGLATFLCDGSSDSRFDGQGSDAITQPENNTVSPGGKQIHDVWAIKPGGVTGKDDFSHAYSLFRLADSSCDADSLADDRFLALGGHRGDNEGDAFWGFELSQIAPAAFGGLASNSGSVFDLDFNRSVNDLLISFTLVGGGTNPLLEVFSWNGTTFAPAASLCVGGSQGDSLLRTNPTSDIQAPPWNVPVCDPTTTNSSNACRVVNGSGAAPAQSGDTQLATRDFNEAMIDLSAFVPASVCFNALIFTSRSAHPLETADLKDVAGANLNTCPAPAAPPAPAPPPAPPPPSAPGTPSSPPFGPPVAFPPTGGEASDSDGARWLYASAGVVLGLAIVVQLARRECLIGRR